jgi:hypothetical protein
MCASINVAVSFTEIFDRDKQCGFVVLMYIPHTNYETSYSVKKIKLKHCKPTCELLTFHTLMAVAVEIKIPVFWDVTPCILVEIYRTFRHSSKTVTFDYDIFHRLPEGSISLHMNCKMSVFW